MRGVGVLEIGTKAEDAGIEAASSVWTLDCSENHVREPLDRYVIMPVPAQQAHDWERCKALTRSST